MATDLFRLAVLQILTSTSVLHARHYEEPMCTSRFDFEEKLLQKMVRLEHKMELLQDTVNKQLADLDQVKNNILQETRDFFEEIKTEQADALSNVNKSRDTMATSLSAFMDEKQTSVNEKIREIDQLLNKHGSTITFSVKDAKKDLVGGLVTFSRVLINEGSAYDVKTGIFTIPYNGIYLFTFNIRSSSSNYCYCYIRKNGVKDAYAISDGANDMGSVTVYLQLRVGDTIELGDCGLWTNVNPGGTAFSGQLLVKR